MRIRVVKIVTSALCAFSLQAGDHSKSDVDDILELHNKLLESHRKRNAGGVVESESEQIVVVSRGEVQFPTKTERHLPSNP